MAVSGAKINSETVAEQQVSAGKPLDGEILPAATTIEIAAATMLGDIRDPILDQIRLLDQPWSKLKAHEQRRVVHSVERICRESITQMVGIFSRLELPSVGITIGPLSAKDETLTVKITCEKSDEAALSLLNTPRATLVFVDEKTFMGEREAAKVDPDQPHIPFPEAEAAAAATEEVAERETAPGGIPLDEAEKLFEASKKAADAKAAETPKGRRRGRLNIELPADEEPDAESEAEMPATPREPVEA